MVGRHSEGTAMQFITGCVPVIPSPFAKDVVDIQVPQIMGRIVEVIQLVQIAFYIVGRFVARCYRSMENHGGDPVHVGRGRHRWTYCGLHSATDHGYCAGVTACAERSEHTVAILSHRLRENRAGDPAYAVRCQIIKISPSTFSLAFEGAQDQGLEGTKQRTT